jgi:hypothetical protein
MADTPISGLLEVTVLADDDWITAVDISNTTNNATGENVKIKKSNVILGETQAASVDGVNDVVFWSSEAGWSISSPGAGTYNVTFPTSAPSADAQAIMVMPIRTTGYSEYHAQVSDKTVNGCTVYIITSTYCEEYEPSPRKW